MNSKRIFQIRAFAVCFVSVVGLAACGGGGSNVVRNGSQVNVVPPPSESNVEYGAIYSYYENGNKIFNYRFQRNTETEARNHALSICREDSSRSRCEIVDTFTNCASNAWSGDRSVFSYATGDSLSSARTSALAECSRLGGSSCETNDSNAHCITPVTPQTSKAGGFNNTPSAPSEPSGGNARIWGVVYSVPDPAPFRRVDFFVEMESEAEALSYIRSDNIPGFCSNAGLDCRAEFTFTNCFGVAVAGSQRHFDSPATYGYVGFATADSKAIADELALEQCRRLGGDEHPDPQVRCTVIQARRYAQACNSVITPQTSKVRGFLNTTYRSVAIASSTSVVSPEYEYRHLVVRPRGDVTCGAERCEVQEEFDFTNCFALASDGLLVGRPGTPELTYTAFASSNTLSGAESLALEQCRRLGRSSDCKVGGLYSDSLHSITNQKGCNIPITPQPSKVMGVRHRVRLDSQQE